LSSVLSDPKRSRSEVHAFFTRHWGDSFVPKTRIASSPALPAIDLAHFKNYLDTIAKKHLKYVKAKRELSRCLTRREENTRTDTNDVPPILLSPHFSLADSETFEAIFLEPKQGDAEDQLWMVDKTAIACSSSTNPFDEDNTTPESTPKTSRQADRSRTSPQKSNVRFDAGRGRVFRSYETLQNRLEYYHDVVDSRLNNQLAAKSNSFWKTVKSCGSLYGELNDAQNKVKCLRKNLQEVNEKVYLRMVKIIELYKRREQREKLLQKLQDISCLRDAQLTVQMLLNQSDYPKALECIETAQDVLRSDLRGILCFRHLSSQLQELYKVIGKMLQEEFVALVQKELGRSCETEAEATCQDGQFNPVVIGLLRVRELRFVHVLQQEIVEAIKNLLRQTIKSHVVSNCSANGQQQLSVYDPTLGSLGNQMRKLSLNEWLNALEHLLHVLFYMCRRVQTIQELITENIDRYVELYCDSGNVVEQPQCTSSLSMERIEQTESAFSQQQQSNLTSNTSSSNNNNNNHPSIIVEQDDEPEDDLEDDLTVDGVAESVDQLPDLSPSGSVTSMVLDPIRMPKLPSTVSLDRMPSDSTATAPTKHIFAIHHSQSSVCVHNASDLQHQQKHAALFNQRRASIISHGDSANSSDMSTQPPLKVSTPAAVLSMPCRNIPQVRQSISLLTGHATYTAQERSCRLFVARSKDGFLERLSLCEFQRVLRIADEFINRCGLLIGREVKYSSPLQLCIVQLSARFIKHFHQDRKAKLSHILDSENWRAGEVPELFQRIVDECLRNERLSDVSTAVDQKQSSVDANTSKNHQNALMVDGEPYVVVGTALLVLQMMAEYCDALAVLPEFASELLMCVVEVLKNFNSRSCQLILGAGALQLIGLKSISVKHLGSGPFHTLSSRCLQLILRFIPYLKADFEKQLSAGKQNQLRHVTHIMRDYNDHIDEIVNKLISVIEHHTVAQLQQWEPKGSVPSAAFQQISKQLGKFYGGLTGIMPEEMIQVKWIWLCSFAKFDGRKMKLGYSIRV
uniref:Vacuolar protein sorting-associated protein 54 n=1 Tax=Anisakis simplex TaxID=6269 RepID=A0A0M3IYS3_ANISI